MRILKPLYGAQAPKLPVLRMTGAVRTDKGRGATQVPTFELVRWITRPAILEDNAVLDDGDSFDAPFIGPAKPAVSPAASPWADVPSAFEDPFADLPGKPVTGSDRQLGIVVITGDRVLGCNPGAVAGSSRRQSMRMFEVLPVHQARVVLADPPWHLSHV